MKKISLLELYDQDYTLSKINVLMQYCSTMRTFDCIGKPKASNMLLYLDGCKAQYTLPDGSFVQADSGTFVYTPQFSEYVVRFYDFETPESNTIGVNFFLHDSHNQPMILSDSILVFDADNANYRSLFKKLESYGEANLVCTGKLKSLLYDLLFHLSEYDKKVYSNKYSVISKGISYLEENDDQSLKIGDIAKMCNVSEVYFRRLFKSYSGMTPVEYRNTAKIHKAKIYLQQDDLSIAEISDRLGFGDISYFIKMFHEKAGMPPTEYKKQYFSKIMKR